MVVTTLKKLLAQPLFFAAGMLLVGCGSNFIHSRRISSRIVLGQADEPEAVGTSRQMLVNLDGDVPAGFERYERVIELVGTDEADRQSARARWKHYASRGYALVRHDVSGAAA